MLFPMYTVSLEDALVMSIVESHDVLKSKGMLVEFETKMGKAAFVSHQWAQKDHPDPTFEQFSVFQAAMKKILNDLSHIPLLFAPEARVPGARPLSTKDMRSVKLFIWYDYFSCPQHLDLSDQSELGATSQQQAIASIHCYVAASSYFFALCPFINDPTSNRVLDASSWRTRGWCRLERTMRELSDGSWILIQSAQHIELVVATEALMDGSVGEGKFAVTADKFSLGPVLAAALRRKMLQALEEGDFVTYRIVRNLQGVHLQGLSAQPELDLVPGFVPSSEESSSAVAHYFHQNGFIGINEVDRAGFCPLHYAALNGDPKLISALLEHRADLFKTTRQSQPLIGTPPWTSALGIAMVCKNNEAAELLIAAKAKVEGGGLGPVLHLAGQFDNAEGIRLICEAGGDAWQKDIFGATAFMSCCGSNSLLAFEELLIQAGTNNPGLPKLLHGACSSRTGGMKMARRLIEMRADVNEQFQVSLPTIEGLVFAGFSLQYRLGKVTSTTRALGKGNGNGWHGMTDGSDAFT